MLGNWQKPITKFNIDLGVVKALKLKLANIIGK
jgi:hypothetical protein